MNAKMDKKRSNIGVFLVTNDKYCGGWHAIRQRPEAQQKIQFNKIRDERDEVCLCRLGTARMVVSRRVKLLDALLDKWHLAGAEEA